MNSVRDIRISIGNVDYENNVQSINETSLMDLENISRNMKQKERLQENINWHFIRQLEHSW